MNTVVDSKVSRNVGVDLVQVVGLMLVVWGLVFGVVTPVWADGNEVTKETKKVCTTGAYGNVVCHDVVVDEHEPVETGVAGNLLIAGGLFAVGYVSLMATQKLARSRVN